MSQVFAATSLTGGGTGALDAISGALLSDLDMCIVADGTSLRVYSLDADSGLAESSPGVISPDTTPGTKRWIEQDPGWIKYLFDANSILYATTDNTPLALTVAASRIVGRKSSGNIVALTGAEALALLNTTASRILGQKAAGDCTAITGDEARTILGLAATDGPTLDHLHLTSGQIGFPAVQVASADANTLDDYEEGTWTPTVTFGGASVDVTYDDALTGGNYVKIGRLVMCTGRVVLTNKGSSVGAAVMSGLPFTVASGNDYFGSPCFGYVGGMTFANQYSAYIAHGSTSVTFVETTEAGALTGLTNSDFTNTTEFMVTLTYIASA